MNEPGSGSGRLAGVGAEVSFGLEGKATLRSVLDALEPPATPLPEAVETGEEPLFIIGAIAGGSG